MAGRDGPGNSIQVGIELKGRDGGRATKELWSVFWRDACSSSNHPRRQHFHAFTPFFSSAQTQNGIVNDTNTVHVCCMCTVIINSRLLLSVQNGWEYSIHCQEKYNAAALFRVFL